MRKLILTGMAVAMLAVPTVASANAGSSSGINSGGVGSTQGNAKNTTQQYKVSYVDPVMGPVSCTGVHKSGKTRCHRQPDSWTCTSTTGSPLTGATAGQVVDLGWNSDYFPLTTGGQVPDDRPHHRVARRHVRAGHRQLPGRVVPTAIRTSK